MIQYSTNLTDKQCKVTYPITESLYLKLGSYYHYFFLFADESKTIAHFK